MKFIRILMFVLFLAPGVSAAASSEFMVAAQLLAAAKNADIQQVQSLVNAGADINFVDSTGLSIVCTALMNNDIRAAQILQMYGADASKCDTQIKRYNNRTKPKSSGGLFSGLSSAQTIGLAAAGAAVVIGGLFLLTDVFDPGNDNDGSASGGNRPDNNPDGGGGVNGNPAYSVAYSPAYLGADGKLTTDNTVYLENLASWNPSAGGLRAADFNYFRTNIQPGNNYDVDGLGVPMQNYLLMMHGYSAFANEYMGQTIFRDKANNNNPVVVSNKAGGGAPVAVGLVTANGLNPAGSADRSGGIEYANSAAADATTYLVDKYLNFANPDAGGVEIAGFDFSGAGTAMNPFASPYENALGKIVAGWETGDRKSGDLMGFVPNGRLAIYKTGNGMGFVNVANPTSGAVVATVTDTDANSAIGAGDKIIMGGVTYNVVNARGDATVTEPTITIGNTTYDLAENSQMLLAKCSGDACDGVADIAIYQGTDGYYYVNTTGGNAPDAVYVLSDNNLYMQKEQQNTDYKNFEALDAARSSGVSVLANVALIDASREAGYKNIADMPAYIATSALADTEDFMTLVNQYYGDSQGAFANKMFNAYGASSPVLVMPAGDAEFNNDSAKTATFENYAPLLYGSNLNQRFMTVVAVRHQKGTYAADSIEAYGNGVGENYGPLYLSMYEKDDTLYSSRTCGVAGRGNGEVDPWCFAAAGPTTEMAAASAAGAFASLQAAFDYMSNSQIYQLMALTADGYLLGTATDGTAFTKDSLVTYLKQMYALPPEYNVVSMNADQYLDAFAEVYGYGLINLERAMTPGRSIYFYDGTKIVSANGNAYWRAASNTMFRPSAALNLRGASISAPFFDVVQSVDGKMTLPRVWENQFAFGATDSHGLYIGDVLGDLSVRRESAPTTKIGNLDFSIDVSERAYVDNMGGLDNLSLGYDGEYWNFGVSYQRYLTDGASRFAGLHNPIMGLATSAVVSDAKYKYGKWSFGGRAFSGMISDEGLLENDPTVAAQYMPAKLGLIQGAGADVAWRGDKVSFKSSVGAVAESDTLLGAYTDGLLNLGNGNTTYVDFETKYKFSNSIDFTARATFARTTSDASGGVVLGLSDIESNAFAFGANVGNFEFSVSQPLAITDGALQYSYAKYDVVDNANGTYDLNVLDTHVESLSLKPDVRETRFMATYRHKFGEFTDGAVGFIYRVNPNHTDDFGNESVFMLKLSHRLGI